MKLLTKIVQWLLILVTAFVLSEAYLRLFNPVALIPRNVVASPFGIRVNKPNHTYWQVTPDYRVRFHTNSKGIRSDIEFPYPKPPGVKRIVVLGDSFGMGYEVDIEDSFLSRMEKKLKQSSIQCEIINLSVSGHGNAEELIMLQNEGLKYHPDLVLLAWHFTDLDDNIRSALYRVEDGNKLARLNPSYLPGVRLNELLSSIPGYSYLAENSQLYFLIRETVAGQMKKLLLELRSRKPAPATETSTQAAPQLDGPEVTLTRLLLKEIKATCGAAGANFLILDVPEQDYLGKLASAFHKVWDGSSPEFEVVSPIPELERLRGRTLFWLDYHRHFTPVACEAVGEALAEFILRKGLLR